MNVVSTVTWLKPQREVSLFCLCFGWFHHFWSPVHLDRVQIIFGHTLHSSARMTAAVLTFRARRGCSQLCIPNLCRVVWVKLMLHSELRPIIPLQCSAQLRFAGALLSCRILITCFFFPLGLYSHSVTWATCTKISGMDITWSRCWRSSLGNHSWVLPCWRRIWWKLC